jgi:hypothetical protein
MAIDPSTTCTGVAFFCCTEKWRRIHCCQSAAIKPPAAMDAYDKIDFIVQCVFDDDLTADTIVIEKPGYRHKGKVQSYLKYVACVTTLYNKACDMIGREHVYGVTALTWKKTLKKQPSVDKANLLYGLDLASKDHDIAEAIMLGTWFIERMRIDPLVPYHACTI